MIEFADRLAVEVDGAAAGSGLDTELDRLAADILKGAGDRQPGGRGVEVGPLESDDLATAHAGVGSEVKRRVEPVMALRGE